MKTLVLCADRMSVDYPITLGLPDEQPMRQPWLQVVHSGTTARSLIRSYTHDVEVWVASSDDIAPVNIAAIIKQENPSCTVCLVAYDASTGSLKSRASQARIDSVWTPAQFLERYREEKRRYMNREGEYCDAACVEETRDEQTCSEQACHEEARGDETCGEQFCGAQAHCEEDDRAEARREEESEPTRLLTPNEVETMRAAAGRNALPDRSTSMGDAGGKRKAAILSVVSGSGGAGKSSVSVLAALLAQMKGYKTLLIDLDMQFGDVAFMLGAQRVVRLDEVVAAPGKLDQLRCQPAMPAILGAPLYMEQTEDVANGLADVLDAVSERFDVIVANTGSFWADQHISLLERSSTALFLIDQRPSSLRACKHALELCARCGIASSPFVAVANRCQKGALYTSIDVSCALQGMPAKELREGGPEVEEFLSSGQVGDLIKSKNELCLSIDGLLDEILPEKSAESTTEVYGEAKTPKGMLALFRRRGH